MTTIVRGPRPPELEQLLERRRRSGAAGVWHDTAVLVVEVLSPDDMTFDKLDFYTAHGVRELLVVDWQDRSVRCFALQEEKAERDRSEVLGMTTAEVGAAVDWPPLEEASGR